jgi:LEA14-like dessication related protein
MKTILSLVISAFFLASCGSTSNISEPEYRDIRDIRLIEAGILKSKAGMDLVYYNPNNFGVTLTDARGDVYIDGHWLGKFEVPENVNVKKRSEFIVPAVVNVDMIGAIKNQRELFKKKEAEIRIDGYATVRKAGISKQIPIKYTSIQNIEKFRGMVSL